MDASDNVGKSLSFKECLFDAHVQPWELAAFARIVAGSEGIWIACVFAAKGFARLVEAIEARNRAEAHEILCSWGIRR